MPARDGATLAARAVVVAVLSAAAVAPAVAAGALHEQRARPSPTTLVQLSGRIGRFAQDGDRLAWMTANCRGLTFADEVVLRMIATGRSTVLGSGICGAQGVKNGTGLALGAERVVYWGEGTGNTDTKVLLTAAPGSGRPRVVATLSSIYPDGGGYVVGVDGDAGTLVYGWARVISANDTRCVDEPVPCRWRVVNGGVGRISDRRPTRVPRIRPPALIDVAAGRIAVVNAQAAYVGPSELPRPAVGESILVHDARTGAVRTTISPRGPVLAVALSRVIVAVLVRSGPRGAKLERHDARTGKLIDRVPVPGRATDVDAEGRLVVYRVGRAVLLVSAAGRRSLVARTSSTPIGLSIEGRRVAWAENVGGRGRIRAVTLGE